MLLKLKTLCRYGDNYGGMAAVGLNNDGISNSSPQNGGYRNPPRVKRQFRDPYGGWWDQQEKRNFGEPVHEENEILGVFSPEQYTHVSARKGFFHLGVFVAAFLSVCGVVSYCYPDKPSVPKTYPGGLEKELGGPNAVPVCHDPLSSMDCSH